MRLHKKQSSKVEKGMVAMGTENSGKNWTAAAVMLLAMISAANLPRTAGAETVLRVGMTAADIPRTLGQPDQGFEGNRFTGLTMYDALTMWDLSSADKPSVVIPGLATEWAVDNADRKKWTFKLRPGVIFHDGSPFNADAVVWNVEKVLKQDAPQFDPSQVGVTASRMPTLASARKIDDMTVELTTKEPDSFLPINLTNLFMASPAKWQKLFEAAEGADAKTKSQGAWAAFAKDASGTGPWKMSSFTPRERLELVKNENYWDKARVPKVDKMLLLPMPEASFANAAHAACDFTFASAPSAASNSFCHFAGLAMNRLVKLMGRKLSGSLVVNSTVMSSSLRAEANVGIRDAVTPTWLGSNWTASCLSTLSTFQTTASALNDEPSWNLTPGRSLNVHFFLSVASTAHSVARAGINTLALSADERSHIVSASNIVRPVKRLPSKP